MATPINAPMAGEIWHLSIDDLFQPVQEVPRLGGEGPFVINLSASTAPISIPTKPFAGCRDAHVYQIQVPEDGRTRYRLRLGPFASEDEADAILIEVRDTYPGALTATAGAPDLRVIAKMQAKADSRQPPAHRPASVQKPAEKPVMEKLAPEKVAARCLVADKPAVKVTEAEISIDIAWPTPNVVVPPAPPRRAAPAAPKAEVAPAVVRPLELTPEWAVLELLELEIPQPKVREASPVAPVLTEVVAPVNKAAAPKAVAPAPAPAPVAVAAPVLTEAVAPKPKAPPMPAASVLKAPADKPAPVITQSNASPPKSSATKPHQSLIRPLATRLTSLQHVVVATAPAPAARQVASAARQVAPAARGVAPAAREVKKLDQPLESLESTQTMRALTVTELEDSEASRWFVIELALADHAFDPDAVPNLDLFSEYRLYSVAGQDQGRVVHALRLGFFREEIAAVAVASYVGTFWDKPAIKRVSLAERERFADQRVHARKDVGATGLHAVIEITDELVARRKRTSNPLAPGKAWNPIER
jgi:hypothetical protein